ncbi:hypothetical protein C8Q75DRAFT_808575 [Abortiporus biennis]|nr:hypothetical protein C8Q75DRAFT_808575 [Abortiporus biennis]
MGNSTKIPRAKKTKPRFSRPPPSFGPRPIKLEVIRAKYRREKGFPGPVDQWLTSNATVSDLAPNPLLTLNVDDVLCIIGVETIEGEIEGDFQDPETHRLLMKTMKMHADGTHEISKETTIVDSHVGSGLSAPDWTEWSSTGRMVVFKQTQAQLDSFLSRIGCQKEKPFDVDELLKEVENMTLY